MFRRPFIITALVLTAAGFSSGCTQSPLPTGSQAPDFSLPDINATSATFGSDVSPRDYVGRGTAWFFAHSN